MDFKEIYEKKTGEDPWFQDELKGTFGLTQDYVDWLEEQLCISHVVGQSKQLLAYTKFLREELHLNISDTWVESYIKNSK